MIRQAGTVASYSFLSAIIGSTRAARRAGIQLANSAIAAIAQATDAYTAGSPGRTPRSRFATSCAGIE